MKIFLVIIASILCTSFSYSPDVISVAHVDEPGPVRPFKISKRIAKRPLLWQEDHPERADWTEFLVREFSTQLEKMDSAIDISDWCLIYPSLGRLDRAYVWATMAVEIARYESDFNPHAISKEPIQLGLDSVGLFQLSYEDQFSWCSINKHTRSLEDPLNNIKCAVTEMANLVVKDNVIATGWTTRHTIGQGRGLARYWSTMWPEDKSRDGKLYAIRESVQQFCGGL